MLDRGLEKRKDCKGGQHEQTIVGGVWAAPGMGTVFASD